MTRTDALIALLAIPDEPCMPRRGFVYLLDRDRRRDPWIMKRDLGIAYAEHRRQGWTDGDISCVVAVRRLKVMRRA